MQLASLIDVILFIEESKDHNDAEAWDNQGIIVAQLGNYQEAIKCFEKAIEIRPDFAEAWYHKGVALTSLRQHQEAIKCLNINVQSKFNDFRKQIRIYRTE